jgi:16S rRNA (cytidine1402-2'-O)-methyltransferase
MVPGTLFVVATPIGNLEDITLRALRVLREADVIAAEDTRHTAKLLAHHGISTPTLSFHAHNTRTRLPQLIARLRAGARVALVSDAGTPGISDPGVELVQACRTEGIPVDPIPGPSAPLAAATGAGFPMTPLSFLGFAPPRSNDRKRWLTTISGIPHTCVFFEAPTRVEAMLREAAELLGDRPMAVARELTKVHQEFVSGTAAFLSGRFQNARGEFTIVLGPWTSKPDVAESATDQEIAAEFWHSANDGCLSRREAIAQVAQKFGKSHREIYSAVERAKNSGQ